MVTCLSSGSLASRKHSRPTGIVAVTPIAGLAFPLVLLEGLGRVGVLCFREYVCLDFAFSHLDGLIWTSRLIHNIWKLWSFPALKFCDALSSLAVWNPVQDRSYGLSPSPPSLFFFKDCRQPRPLLALPCGRLGGATTNFMFSVKGKKPHFLAVPLPPSSRIPVNYCYSKVVTNLILLLTRISTHLWFSSYLELLIEWGKLEIDQLCQYDHLLSSRCVLRG